MESAKPRKYCAREEARTQAARLLRPGAAVLDRAFANNVFCLIGGGPLFFQRSSQTGLQSKAVSWLHNRWLRRRGLVTDASTASRS